MNFDELVSSLPGRAVKEVGELPFPKVASGKVREIYDLGDRLLIIATDRLSAFDVVLPDGVPDKGILLTQLSLWWFAQTEAVMPNHLVPNHDNVVRDLLADFPELALRSMVVQKLKPLPIEAVVRAYLAGSGWKAYRDSGKLFDKTLPEGLQESSRLPEVLFTPTTKAQAGHDEPISDSGAADLIGQQDFDKVKAASLAIFKRGTELAEHAGLILADTKFEFGRDTTGKLVLIDEVLTPDSSRFWPAAEYQPGRPQQAFDKQYVRDYLETLDWDKTAPGPKLPVEVIDKTRAIYLAALEKLMK